MHVPVRLYRRSSDGAIVETLAPGESGILLYGEGAALVESLAEASGIAAYVRQRGTATKAVHGDAVEDKAVSQDETEDKALSVPERGRGVKR